MSLNIPPAAGVKPHEAAQRLRVLIKSLIAGPLVQGGPWSESVHSQRAALERQERIERTHNSVKELDSFLDQLVQTSRLRKPSLVSQAVFHARVSGALFQLRRCLDNEHMYQLEREKKIIQRANEIMAAGAPSHLSEKLKEIYSLVQVIPTTPNPTDASKEARTLRAITAVLKAHFGMIEGEFAQVDQPELPIILMQTKEIPVEKIVEVEKLVYVQEVPPLNKAAEAPSYVTGPFEIWSAARWMNHDIMTSASTYAAHALHQGTAEFWNSGSCLLEEAIEALWAVRAKSNRSVITLRYQGDIVAEIRRASPINIYWSLIPKFEILGDGGNALENSLIMVPWQGGKDFGDPQNHGDNSGWNSGSCVLPAAIATLRHVRRRYSDSKFTLRRGGKRYAVARALVPAQVYVGGHLLPPTAWTNATAGGVPAMQQDNAAAPTPF